MIVGWTLLAALGVATLAAVLIGYLVALVGVLDRLGGQPTSLLARIRMGVRAIEVETGHLPLHVERLNAGAAALRHELQAVAAALAAAAHAVGGRR
ncbi:MAG: hypothetical protein QN157_11930 [Armatimonadota bacterium]|nr:hypothetical protein [Armatimonadota bacterium]